MNTRIAFRLVVAVGVLGLAATAVAQETIHDYLSDTALRVQASDNPVQKRAILGQRLHAMERAIDVVTNAPLTSKRDEPSLARIQTALREKSDELAGTDGFERVPDDQLNAFSTYVVQDMEQADRTISISVVTLLLIVVIVLLVA
jgi:hypothetical protein